MQKHTEVLVGSDLHKLLAGVIALIQGVVLEIISVPLHEIDLKSH